MPEIVQEIGAYAGLAAVVGLAVLVALYFSQARDVKRLREWAGRAPERATEQVVQQPVPQRVVAQPKPAGPQPGTPTPAPPAVPAPGGAKPAAPAPMPKPAPAQAAAAGATAAAAKTAAATPAGQAAEHGGGKDEQQPVPAPVPAAATAAPTPAPAAPPATPAATRPPPPVAPPTAASGAKTPRLPSRPAEPRQPSPSQTAILPPYGQAPEPWHRRLLSSPRYLVLALAGVLVIGGGAAYGLAELAEEEAPPPSEEPQSRFEEDGGNGEKKARKGTPINPASVTVSVLNGTTVPGLAAQIGDKVESSGFQLGNITNNSDQQRAESVVLFAPGNEREAAAVGRRLRIGQREPIDPQSQTLGGDATVVVIAGADQTQ